MCHGTPGVYLPREVRRLQYNWRGNPDVFWARFTMDYHYDDNCGDATTSATYYLRPIADRELPGSMASVIPTYGACTNLGPSGCTLQRSDMPMGCVTGMACVPCGGVDKGQSPVTWRNESGRSVIRDFKAANRRLNPNIELGNKALHAQTQDAAVDAMLAAFANKRR
jgi:hypothetical protein